MHAAKRLTGVPRIIPAISLQPEEPPSPDLLLVLVADLDGARGHCAAPHQVDQFIRRQSPHHVRALEQALGEVSLLRVQGQHRLFDGALRDQADDRDRTRLADPVGPIGGLILDGGVPPRVEVNDVIGGRQVEPRASGLQGDQEQVAFAALERLDGARPLVEGRGAVEVDDGDPAGASASGRVAR
jgi:hypothetical protein